MKYVVTTDKGIDDAVAAIEDATRKHGFGVLHVHDLQATMRKKGVEFPRACRILDICNPHRARAVLLEDMELSLALPCRISVWEDADGVRIGVIRPTALMSAMSDSESLSAVAREVEETLIRIVVDAR